MKKIYLPNDNLLKLFSVELQDSEASSAHFREIREILNALPAMDISVFTELPKHQKCGEHDVPCDHTTFFRSISGWCNNLLNPRKGTAFQTFRRLLPPEYHDGIMSY